MSTTKSNGQLDGERTRRREMPEWMYNWGAYPDVTKELAQARELLADWVRLHKFPNQEQLMGLRKVTRVFLQEKR